MSKRLVSIVMVVSMLMGATYSNTTYSDACDRCDNVICYDEENGESYIVTAGNKRIDYIEDNFDGNLLCNYEEYESSDGTILSMTLSDDEVRELNRMN